MKALITLFISILFAVCLQAQTYSFSVENGTYAELEGATSLVTESLWDEPEIIFPLEMDFTFFDEKLEYLFSEDDSFFVSDSTYTGKYNFLIPFGADLIDRAYDSSLTGEAAISTISATLDGQEGSRIQKIQWKNAGFYNDIAIDSISTDYVNFQLWLYEETGTIELHFGEMNVLNPEESYEYGSGPFIALVKGVDEVTELTEEFLYLVGTAQNPVLLETQDFYDYYYNDDVMSGTPANGEIYRFERTAVGVNDGQPTQEKYSLSPNPASNLLRIDQPINQSNIESLEIYNASGQLIQSELNPTTTLNISKLPAGIFYLHIQDEDEMSIQRFVKLDK